FVAAGGGAFPDDEEGATCPLCQQGLGGEAHERLHRFEAFVSGELREQVRQVDLVLTERLGSLPDLQQILHAAELAVASARKARLRQLRARQEIVGSLEDIVEHLEALERIAAWEAARKQLSTGTISHRIRELSKLAITGRLKQALAQEIEEIDPIADRVELNA